MLRTVISKRGRFPRMACDTHPGPGRAGPEVSARSGWRRSGQAEERLAGARLAGNVLALRSVAASEGGAPGRGQGRPVGA